MMNMIPRSMSSWTRSVCIALCCSQVVHGAGYSIDTDDDIRQTAKTIAWDLLQFYSGNQSGQVPGILPGPPSENKGPYYWWEGGAMMSTLIDYWHYTGDSTYNDLVMQGMLHQTGENDNYMPSNYTASLGNDDQGFWGMSAMLAAENKFPNPPKDRPQWLELAQAVWNTQADPSRHDNNCNGGLRWQIPFANAGYDYKNTIANAIFFNMGARLARYTGNQTYAKHAEDTWNWIWGVNYINHDTYEVYDGGHVEHNCTDITKIQYSYNAVLLAQGAGFMYNNTNGDEKWGKRLDALMTNIESKFFRNGAAYELACEGRKGACSADMLTYKGFMHRWLSVVSLIAPRTADKIQRLLKTSAQAAIKQCTGGSNGRLCGFYWSQGVYVDPEVDKTTGAGEAMDALAAVSSLLWEGSRGPVTSKSGGISKGNPNAGSGTTDVEPLSKITTADRAGAGILTFLLLGSAIGTFAWMSI